MINFCNDKSEIVKFNGCFRGGKRNVCTSQEVFHKRMHVSRRTSCFRNRKSKLLEMKRLNLKLTLEGLPLHSEQRPKDRVSGGEWTCQLSRRNPAVQLGKGGHSCWWRRKGCGDGKCVFVCVCV